jgi:hypothetical protein
MHWFFAAVLSMFVSSQAWADVPSFVTWSGRLTDGTASEATATLALTVSLWDAEAGGKRIWQASFPAVVVENGYFTVVLGPGVDPVTGGSRNVTDVFAANGSTWVTVAVADGLDLEPRQAIGSVPYAVRANEAPRTAIRIQTSRYSLGAVYRTTTEGKVTSGTFDATGKTKGRIALPGATEGYRSAKLACELAVGSPSAHACTPQEMVASQSLWVSLPGYSWIATGTWAIANSSGTYLNDCDGFTGDTDSNPGLGPRAGVAWAGGRALYDGCATAKPVACCDFPID